MVNILDVDIYNLQEEQLKELKRHTVEVLHKIAVAVEKEDFKAIKDNMQFSPAGDGYGDENHFIDFSWSGPTMDIGEIVEKMESRRAATWRILCKAIYWCGCC